MAQMADAFMKGFGFTDNMIRNHVEDARRTKEYDQLTADREGFKKGTQMLLQSQYGEDAPKLPQRAYDVTEANLSDPISAAKAVDQFEGIKLKLDAGESPSAISQDVVDYFNNPNVAGRDLESRVSGHGLKPWFSGIYPMGKDGVAFEIQAKNEKGEVETLPLTVNKTRAGTPGSESDPVQVFKVQDLMKYGAEAADANRAALDYLAANGGMQGAQFALQWKRETDATRRAALIREYEYQRQHADKVSDREATQAFELKKQQIDLNAKNQDKYTAGHDSEGNPTYVLNEKTGALRAPDGTSMSASGGAKPAFKTELGIVVKNDKDAASKMKDLGGVFMQKAVGSGSLADELAVAFKKVEGDMTEMAPAQKESIAAAARRIENDPNSTIEERSAAKNFREIGAYRGFWPGDSKVNPGMASSHNKSAMNPGNIRNGQGGQITGYKTPEEGVAAVDSLLKTYGSKHGLNTISGIMSRYSPPSENDTKAIISSISKMTGFAPDAQLDMDNPATRTILAGAIFRQEHGTQAFTKQGASKNTQQNATGKPIDLNQFKRASATPSTTGEAQAATAPPAMSAVEQPVVVQEQVPPEVQPAAPVQAPSLSSVQRVSQLAGQTARGIADAGTVTGETMGLDTSSLPETTGSVLLKLRDEGEKLGTTEWWKNSVAALSEKALMALKAIGEKQRIDAAKIEAAAKARNVSLDQFLQEIASGFASGYSN
jgi:hypothetical protein